MSPHAAHRMLRQDEDLDVVFRWKEERRLTQNLVLHYQTSMYLVAESPQSLALRGKILQVHEFENGTVNVAHGALELAATQFRMGGGVRQQDVADNKYLAATLERVRKVQIANDMQALAEKRMTKREKAALHVSLAERATPGELNAVAPLPPPRAPLRRHPSPDPPRPRGAIRATPSESGPIARLPRTNAPQPSPPNRLLASVLDRLKEQEWQNEVTSATTRRRPRAKV